MAVSDREDSPPEPVVEGSWTAARAGTGEVRSHILLALARVRWLPLEALQANGGDLRVDSKEAEVVISMLEIECGLELAKVDDLKRDELTTVSSLTRLIHGKLAGNAAHEHGR